LYPKTLNISIYLNDTVCFNFIIDSYVSYIAFNPFSSDLEKVSPKQWKNAYWTCILNYCITSIFGYYLMDRLVGTYNHIKLIHFY